MDFDGGNRRVFNRLGGPSTAPTDSSKHQKVCYHWRAGKCTRFPCPFLHRELPYPSGPTANGSGAPKRFADDSGFSGPAPRRGPNFNNNHNNNWGRMGANKVVRKTEKVCNYWVQGNCNYGDKCRFLHSWSLGDGFTMLSHLDGHQKVSFFYFFFLSFLFLSFPFLCGVNSGEYVTLMMMIFFFLWTGC